MGECSCLFVHFWASTGVMSSVDRAQIRISSDQVEFELGDLTLRSTVGGASKPFSTPMTSITRSHRIVVTRRSLATVMRRVSHAAELEIRALARVERRDANRPDGRRRAGAGGSLRSCRSVRRSIRDRDRMRLFGEMVARLPEGRVVIEFDRQDKIAAISSEAHPGVLYFTGLVAVPHLPWR